MARSFGNEAVVHDIYLWISYSFAGGLVSELLVMFGSTALNKG